MRRCRDWPPMPIRRGGTTATPRKESRADTVKAGLARQHRPSQTTLGHRPGGMGLGQGPHPDPRPSAGQQKPLDRLFNVGPFAAPGSHEVPNNLSAQIGPAPWPVTYGPSTRRLIDFADPAHSLGINPVGQSGVLFDKHYQTRPKPTWRAICPQGHLSAADVKANTRSTLKLLPATVAHKQSTDTLPTQILRGCDSVPVKPSPKSSRETAAASPRAGG